MTRKQRLQAEASGLGLSTAGTMQQISDRIDAHLAATQDTAEAVFARKAEPVTPAETQRRRHLDPLQAALAGGAIAAATHFFG